VACQPIAIVIVIQEFASDFTFVVVAAAAAATAIETIEKQ
jgi:hypothetical protein